MLLIINVYIVVLRMVVDGGDGHNCEWEGRWNHVKKFLERSGPFTHPDFEPSTEVTLTSSKMLQAFFLLHLSSAILYFCNV